MIGNNGTDERDLSVDPAVADMLREEEKRERIRRLPKAKRKKAMRDSQRSKATFDIPAKLKEALEEIAGELGCSVSSVAAFLLAEGVLRYRAGELDLREHREYIGNLRWYWRLRLPAEFEEKKRNP